MRLEIGKKVYIVLIDGKGTIVKARIESLNAHAVGLACGDGFFRTRVHDRVYRTREEAALTLRGEAAISSGS